MNWMVVIDVHEKRVAGTPNTPDEIRTLACQTTELFVAAVHVSKRHFWVRGCVGAWVGTCVHVFTRASGAHTWADAERS